MGQLVLRVALIVSFVLFFFLSPLGGLEPRPFATHPWFAAIHPIGFVFLTGVFAAMALNAAALAQLDQRPRRAAMCALVGPPLVAAALAADQLGWFASLPPPLPITIFEYALMAVELLVLATAASQYRANPA